MASRRSSAIVTINEFAIYEKDLKHSSKISVHGQIGFDPLRPCDILQICDLARELCVSESEVNRKVNTRQSISQETNVRSNAE